MFNWLTVIAIAFPLLWMGWDIKKELIKRIDDLEMNLNKLTDTSVKTFEPWKKK